MTTLHIDNKLDVPNLDVSKLMLDIEAQTNNLIEAKRESIINDSFKQLYPVGSIYITLTSLNSTSGTVKTSSSPIKYTWHGCTWEYISSDTFLRNGNTSSNVESGSGETGGSSSHSHTIAGHKLTVDEIPSHDHEQYVTANPGSSTAGEGRADYNNNATGLSAYRQNTTTGSTGGGKVHSHDCESASSLPPYLTVYMYKRIA